MRSGPLWVSACLICLLGLSGLARAEDAPSHEGARPANDTDQPSTCPAPCTVSPRPAEPFAERANRATVHLADGTSVRGTILRLEPGRYVLLLNASGARTIPWQDVARVENPAAEPSRGASSDGGNGPSAPAAPDRPSAGANSEPGAVTWAGLSLGWDIRFEAIALLKRYTVPGQEAWFSGKGAGGGLSASLHFRAPALLGKDGGASFVEFELGVSSAMHYVSWSEGAGLSTTFMENQTSVVVGPHFASGRVIAVGGGSWLGFLFGVAWAPTYVHIFGSDDFASGGALNPAGVRLTVDWGRVEQATLGYVPAIRAMITWLPYVGTLPTAIGAGVGCVFY